MQTKIKHKIVLTLATGLLLTLANPAVAQAPLLSQEVKLFQLALQEPKRYAVIKMTDYKWGKTEYKCLSQLWGKESNWNHKSNNPKSSAFGIAQMLNETSTNPVVQISNGLRYIKHRYENPCNAWKYWQRHYWY